MSSRSFTLTKISNSLTCTVVSSFVCTSPLAVITVMGFLENELFPIQPNSIPFGSACALTLENQPQIISPLVLSRMALEDTIPQQVRRR